MVIELSDITIRPLLKKDSLVLSNWLSDPAVLRYYEGRDNPFDVNKVIKKFFNRDNGVVGNIIIHKGIEIGYIQYYRINETTSKLTGYHPEERIYGMDQFIGNTNYWNKGIGTLVVSQMVKYLITNKSADRILMEPQMQNVRAIKCYEKCGFKKVRILPEHELHEGKYRDCWLIEYKVNRE
ncbi:GNAT family N-acetyltransferase [Litchfieldia alkalitelluris]|uniref:GNAT family N-acetyltransferase n=1 Tax=Litchfieldia alkalitelluris TaxID=304268 RepID=UPI000995FD59|nr:GNAT family N-acetyltransferase [Litchfieldia alkalitelluris]